MISVMRLDKQLMYLNPDQIISIEETPDTVVTLFNGNRYIVVDPACVIISRIVAFRARISRRAASGSAKKYLARGRHSQFHSDGSPAAMKDKANHTPFHSRDY